ncbi:DNA segregation ATPase FtsK/SpoIIIE, S-DNA-T family, partial [Bosea sp. CRIB-10]|uniref:DNA translocase FtsK n=1 Tax=Bosea sp. CRIB-10 TaxID=378404 RepID=UPI0008F00117
MRRIHRNLQTNSASPAARISDQLSDFAEILAPASTEHRASGNQALPGLVRYGRTPDKVRRQDVERAAVEAAVPLPEPEPEAPVDPGRVRYWRTPQRMLQQVWGGGSPEAPAPESATQAEADMAGEGEDALMAPDFASPLPEESPAEAVSTPFAFLSDAAFWEFIPDAEQEDDTAFESAPPVIAARAPLQVAPPIVPMTPAEPARPAAAPVSAPASAIMTFGWTQPYRFELSLTPPALQVIAPAPEPAAPVPAPAALAPASKAPVPRRRIMGQLAPAIAPAVAPVAKAAEPEAAPATAQPKVSVVPAAPKLRAALPMPKPIASMGFELPPIEFLAEPPQIATAIPIEIIQQNSGLLEGILEDFNVRGEVVQACPGPVVTLYELEPAPGTKSSRVISLADDIARSMSAVSARVAVVQGKNAIGIEL